MRLIRVLFFVLLAVALFLVAMANRGIVTVRLFPGQFDQYLGGGTWSASMPLFLFSATFFPVTAYPPAVRWVVEVTPLYRGVVLCRELTTGVLTWGSAFSVLYLVAMGLIGLRVVGRRLDRLLLT